MTGKRHYSDLMLERFVLAELSAARMDEIAREAERDSVLKQRISSIETSNAGFHQQVDASEMLAAIKQKSIASSKKASTRQHWQPVYAIAASIILAITAFIFFSQSEIQSPVYDAQGIDGVRLKGLQPSLHLYRKVKNKVERLSPGASIHSGESVQMGYIAAGQRFGTVFSVDGRGVVTLHYPLEAGDKPVLDNEGEVTLAFSYQLDDAPEFEKFYFVTSAELFSVDEVLQRVQLLAQNDHYLQQSLELPPEFNQFSFLLKKVGK